MRYIITFMAMIIMMTPGLSFAGKSPVKAGTPPAEDDSSKVVDEYGEEYVGDPSMIEQVAPSGPVVQKKERSPAKVEESSVGASSGEKLKAKPEKGTSLSVKPPAGEKQKEQEPKYTAPASRGPYASGRAHRFRVGLAGPGVSVVSDDIGALMSAGFEGEYYFFEKLSAVFKAEAATKFKEPTIMSFVPMARYTFDFARFPRWSVYANVGAGIAAIFSGGTHMAADIVVPGGGFWWQWTEHFSVGADSSLHIYVRGSTAVGINFTPAIRYLF